METTALAAARVFSDIPRVLEALPEELGELLRQVSPVGLVNDLGRVQHSLVCVVAETEIFTNVEEDSIIELGSRL